MKKLKIIIGALLLLLIVSLYFNFKPDSPLYSLNVCVPFKDGSGYTVSNVIDTNNNREMYLHLMNVLEGQWDTAVDKELSTPIPDLLIIRNIPSMGIASGVYGIFFEGEVSYVIIGTEYDGQQVYQFDKNSTEIILAITGYLL